MARSTPTDRLILAKQFGAAVIALTIDEVGMAKTAEDKLRIARRLVDFACNKHGLAQSDLLIDPLTFTIATGNEDDRKLAQWTLEGIAAIRAEFPDIQIILGLSNVSFGLNPAARAVLNSRVPGPRAARRHERRDHPCVEDPAAASDRRGREAGRRRPDLRPPARGLRSAAAAAGTVRRPQSRRCGQERARRDRRGPAEGPHRRWRPQGPDRRIWTRRC